MDTKVKREKRYRRHKRVRAKILGAAEVPRLCVFRSAKHIYAQLTDDEKGKTLAAASDRELKKAPKDPVLKLRAEPTGQVKSKILKSTRKTAIAFEVGKLIAEKALKKKIKEVVFDRGGYKYHGIVKAVAEGAREGGLHF